MVPFGTWQTSYSEDVGGTCTSTGASDRAPTIGSATITPSKLYTSTIATAVANNVSDPDGNPLTYHYAWTVNGAPAGSDSPTLSPSAFTNGDQVAVTITVVDSGGLSASATSSPSTVSWNVSANSALPGGTWSVHGYGFGAGETVDLRADAPTGQVLATVTADSTGSFPATSVTIPSPFAGGQHMLYGVGRSTGTVGPGPATVTAKGTLTPVAVAAGDATTYSGVGFVPGETVSASFPGGAPVTGQADATGSVALTLVSPAEPNPGGVVTAAAPSGTVSTSYTVVHRFTLPSTAEPGNAVGFTLTGYNAGEQVTATFDGGPAAATYTADATGSVNTTLTLSTTFGNHTVAMTGAASAVTMSKSITLPAWMAISPTSGPVGTVITITSGPGWIGGETVHVKWNGGVVKDVTADSFGRVNTTYTIPTHASGPVTVKLSDDLLGVSATATFTVS